MLTDNQKILAGLFALFGDDYREFLDVVQENFPDWNEERIYQETEFLFVDAN